VKRGLFLSFEGGEGSGKSLQARGLADTLTERGREVVLTREPGGTAAGARAQLVREVIHPALEAGKIVIADRFFDSTVVYQGHAHGVSLEAIREVTALAVGTLVPDRTFLLDVPVEVGLARSGWGAEARWDRFEADATDFHVRVRDAYLRLAAAEPRRFVVIAADRDEAAIAKDIRREVDALLGAPA